SFALSLPDSLSRPLARRLWPRGTVLGVSVLSVGLVAALLYLWVGSRSKQTDARPAVRSIAVLPFKTLGREEGDEYMGPGLADAMITKLANIRQLTVRPTGAILKYNSPDRDSLAVGRQLGVDLLLDGHFQRLDDRIRITVQLVRVADGAPLWAEK